MPRAGATVGNTRDRILEVTAQLLAGRGYHGVSTRDIAEQIGIRQPSLFHHFASKQAIFAELLDRNLLPAVARVKTFAALPGPAAPRLCAYLVDDLRDLAASPVDVRGLYVTEMFENPDLAPQRESWNELGVGVRAMVADGIASEELRNVPLPQAERSIFGMVLATVWELDGSRGRDHESWPDFCTEVLLRGLLRRPATFASVRRRADALLADLRG